jgi:low affinity Fe/Cu permease
MARIRQKQRVSRGLGPKQTGGVTHWFSRAANRISEITGNHWTFLVAVVLILVWIVSGPLFGFSDTWQLAANTVTTIITTLMVFIIQNTQNRDAKAMQLKLDELLRAVPRARNAFMDVEEEDLAEIAREKDIVDRDDPNPPKDKAKNRAPKLERGPR